MHAQNKKMHLASIHLYLVKKVLTLAINNDIIIKRIYSMYPRVITYNKIHNIFHNTLRFTTCTYSIARLQ